MPCFANTVSRSARLANLTVVRVSLLFSLWIAYLTGDSDVPDHMQEGNANRTDNDAMMG